ncbi:CAZyme family CE10 [Penicillium canescens]|uniref:CAZyme family CE10 n=1 Tax=Penicillium canescens TaxID=5083 RepID=A0AAD6IBC1_PENCN|nr:CAZyme family CE10 [Penicillium canescens]
MAPEHPVPAALDNVEDAVNSVMARPEKFDLTRLSIPGFSADANLALAASANLQPISLRQVPILDLSFYLMIDLNIDPCAKSTLASTQNLQCLYLSHGFSMDAICPLGLIDAIHVPPAVLRS